MILEGSSWIQRSIMRLFFSPLIRGSHRARPGRLGSHRARPRRASLTVGVALAGLCMATACDPDMITEQEQVGFDRAFAGVLNFYTGDRVLEGSRWCPVWIRAVDETGSFSGNASEPVDASSCFDVSVGGQAQLDAGCLIVGAGASSLELAAKACELGSYVDDRFALDGVGVDTVGPRWASYLGALSGPDSVIPLLSDDVAFPGGGGPVRVHAGTKLGFIAQVVVDEGPVAYLANESAMNFTPSEGATWVGKERVVVDLAEGQAVDTELVTPQGAFSFPQLIGAAVPADATLSIETASEEGAPSFVGAVRDGQGELIFGVPVEFETDEPYLIDTVDEDDDGYLYTGWAALNDTCFEPRAGGREHTAMVRAQFGEMSAEREYSWVQGPNDTNDEWAPDVRCTQIIYADEGCACSSGGGGVAGLFALLPLLGWRRRRRSAPRRPINL